MNKQERRRYRNNAIEKVKELYISDRILEKYRADIGILEEKITRKREEQRCLSGLDSDPEEGFSISFEEKVTFSPSNTSNAERKVIEYIEKLEEDIINTRKEIDEIKDKISQINKEFDFIKDNIRLLGDHEKRVIELLCKDKKTIPYIAVEEFGGVKDTAYRRIYEILDEIMIFENWRG